MHSRSQILRAGRISAITTDTHGGQLLCSFHSRLCVPYQGHSISPGNLACFFMLKINNSGTVCLALQSTISSPSSRVHRMSWVMEILIWCCTARRARERQGQKVRAASHHPLRQQLCMVLEAAAFTPFFHCAQWIAGAGASGRFCFH